MHPKKGSDLQSGDTPHILALKGILLKVVLPLVTVFLGLGSESTLATELGGIDFNGYLRMGPMRSSAVGRSFCFQLPGATYKYRLGNECDTYGEFLFSKDAWESEDGAKLKVSLQPSIYTTDLSNDGFRVNGDNWLLPQAFVEARDIPQLAGAKVWVGRRFYKRENIYINDYFYHNPSGTGAGIEDLQVLGDAKLSYAFFLDNGENDPEEAHRHDFQLRNIGLYAGGSLDTGVQLISKSGSDVTGQTHNGYSVFIRHIQVIPDFGTNELAITYGVGPGTGYGYASSLLNDSRVKAMRIIDTFPFQATPNLGGHVMAGYERTLNPTGNATWITVGGRLSYAFTDHVKLLGELGHDQVLPDGQNSRSLTKLTIAPAFSLGRDFWSRPELRLYYTYAKWNKAAQAAASPGTSLSTSGVFGSATHGSNFGIQVETWW
jgi:maltoporin